MKLLLSEFKAWNMGLFLAKELGLSCDCDASMLLLF